MSTYAITIDLPTAKPMVEVAGLGLFPNRETTVLTDEQVWYWFNRVGAQPLAQFQEGITISEVKQKTTSSTNRETKAEVTEASEKVDEASETAEG